LASAVAAVARRAESVCWRLLAACAFLSLSFAAERSSIILAGLATILLNRLLKPHLTFCLAKYIFLNKLSLKSNVLALHLFCLKILEFSQIKCININHSKMEILCQVFEKFLESQGTLTEAVNEVFKIYKYYAALKYQD
jgi:hypothetical protein